MSYKRVINPQESENMKLSFENVQELRDFVKNELKGGPRGTKNQADETGDANAATGAAAGGAPAPLGIPAGGAAFSPGGPTGAAFSPPGGAAFTPGGPAPEVAAIVNRITARIDGAISNGQPADSVLAWFRSNVGDPNAASATMDQIKTVFLPKASMPVLENIAKLMNA